MSGGKMTDIRERLVALIQDHILEEGANECYCGEWEHWDDSYPGRIDAHGRHVADAILAEYEVTERAPMDPGFEDHEAYCHLQQGMGGPCTCKDASSALDSAGHCKTCACGCTCGFGGEHVEDNPRCALTLRGEDMWEYGVWWGDDNYVTNYGERERAEARASELYGDKIVRRRAAVTRMLPAGPWEEVPNE
jgi:hypothetical protein